VIDYIFPLWLWLLVNALASYRLTRLITDDLITEPVRARVRRFREPWASGIECPWCVGFWVSCGVVAVSSWLPELWAPAATVLAFSAVAGWLSSHE
jgi:hypothetical protein